MEDPVANAILNQYFRRLEQALSGLPAERREQIVEDLRAHVADALRSEPDPSEATVLAILDRVGDPDEIAQEALVVIPDRTATGLAAVSRAGLGSSGGNAASSLPRRGVPRLRLLAPMALALAGLIAIVVLTSGSSAAAPKTPTRDPAAGGRLLKGGWLPSGDVSGGGGVDSFRCSPQTMAGSESAGRLEADAVRVGSGSVGGRSWSVWSRRGVRGGAGLEEGGVVVGGVAHGLCAGFPNPAEMELLDPRGGGDAVAYGVVGYSGRARVAIYSSVAGTFDARRLVGSATSRVANGVGFFITRLGVPACGISALELNTASASYATEHNLGFATKHCSGGQLVPISDSQGIWELPPKDFPDHYGSGGGGPLSGRGPVARRGLARLGGASSCSPPTDAAASGRAVTRIVGATQVASGSLDGYRWSLWSRGGRSGSVALEDGGVILEGHAYGLCPGFPNPAELEMIDPSSGRDGIVIGVSGYPGRANAIVFVGTANTFNKGVLLYRGRTVSADGTGFFIGRLPKSACDYSSLELSVKATSGASQHNFGFGSCHPGKLVMITGSMGAWSGSG